MRNILLLLTLCFLMANSMQGQKEDYVWPFAYKYTFQDFTNGIYLDFLDSPIIRYNQRPLSIDITCASICDSVGRLRFYSNGCEIANYKDEIVENSAGLNPGYVYNNFCLSASPGYNSNNTALMLERPDHKQEVFLFHASTYVPQNFNYIYRDRLYYTIIDAVANNGAGKVSSKNNIQIADTLDIDGIAAVRHANGRDWWIVVPKNKSNQYFITYFGTDTLITHIQSIGPSTIYEAGGEMVFSPNGSKLARFNSRDDLRLFDFDRCTGTLSNPQLIVQDDSWNNNLFAGAAFSADGHYLYLSQSKELLQYDMWATDIASTKIIVATNDPPVCPLSGSIGFLELGPDGRIYSRPFSGQQCLHVMKHPERAGVDCTFLQHYYQLEHNHHNLPHFPNFRLGPIDGSACDTLGINNVPLAGFRYDVGLASPGGGGVVEFTSVSWYEPTNWLWDFGDGQQSTERNPVHTFNTSGAHDVCLTVSNQYGSDVKCKTVWVGTTNISEADQKGGITIYPNPTNGRISWSGIMDEHTQIKVFDVLGRFVLEAPANTGSLQMPDNAVPGLYRLIFTSENGQNISEQSFILNK